ncbi:uncharacterized protein LOC132059629 [Lycium ferocissimum]|uniref:uncharacterized protein LOC132059629 n=1 Tax=Lycium ferocissimum TaxID=112874 RepID=UPI00281599BE|nr:uncharacterized protein LOC132059629 [Lycium ferocissimum]XP_059308291.1 uncharacterized protein LOC132059629 [Lycium ferocissimum]XP_059308292.1 uncharacterized protein LOC132059629 [Lycium ferocissimum]
MLEASLNMDPPTNEGDIKPATLEEVKEEGPLFSCNLFDTEMVRKVAQEFLTGLASSCVDNTTGGLFKSPASVAVDIRREMVDYLIQRSESFVAESVVNEGGTETVVSDNPYDNISDFIDDFGQSKRNFFSKVSGWILSERREDRIDDFVQEMEINGFWLMGRRETVAQTVIRNVDFKNTFHCNMKFKSEKELAEHISSCGFREINCENEGCNARFSAAQLEQHDSTCPFKILQCEQKCPEMLMRREMDRHCITICPMKLVNCSFYPVGCQSTVPQCKADEHRQENLQSHLVYILKLIYKEASSEALKKRAEQLEQASSGGRLAAARDARSLTTAIKNIDAKLGPLEVEKKTEVNPEVAELTDKKEDGTDKSTMKDDGKDLPQKNENSSESPTDRKKDGTSISTKKDDGKCSPHKNEKSSDSPTDKKEDGTGISTKKDDSKDSLHKNGMSLDSFTDKKEDGTSIYTKQDDCKDSPNKNEKSPDSSKTQHDSKVAPAKVDSPSSKTEVKEDSTNQSPSKSRSTEPPVENGGAKSPDKNVVSPKSPKNKESSQSHEEHPDLTVSSKKVESPKSEVSALSPKKHQNSSSPEMDIRETKESTPSPKIHHDSTSSPKMESAKSEESILSPKKHQYSTALVDKVE